MVFRRETNNWHSQAETRGLRQILDGGTTLVEPALILSPQAAYNISKDREGEGGHLWGGAVLGKTDSLYLFSL